MLRTPLACLALLLVALPAAAFAEGAADVRIPPHAVRAASAAGSWIRSSCTAW